MKFTTNIHLYHIKGFLDSEEAVRNARISLEQKTAEEYKKLDEAKRKSYFESCNIMLD